MREYSLPGREDPFDQPPELEELKFLDSSRTALLTPIQTYAMAAAGMCAKVSPRLS
jgi:hypothetical protein